MSREDYPPEFLQLLKSISGKRPRTVIDHILKYGQITSQELKDRYGYNHPPRAIRDVREHGVPIITSRIKGDDGRSIAVYKFGDPTDVRSAQLSGRTTFSSQLKEKLIETYGEKCNIYLERFPAKELQIDHRIPFEIVGDTQTLQQNPEEYMLLCASANRAKSWSCEHCENWKLRNPSNCQTCYWAFPESYDHVAMRNLRRLDILWSEDEVADYENLVEESTKTKKDIPEYVKEVLNRHIKKKKP